MQRPRLTILFGQPDQLSTSFQTSELARALGRWCSVVPLRLRAPFRRRWLCQWQRFYSNYFRPLLKQPATDFLLYANDGFADLRHWRPTSLLYWYDAPRNWIEQPPKPLQWVSWLRYQNVRSAGHVFAVSHTLVELAQGLRASREDSVAYLPVGVDCDFFHPGVADGSSARARFALPNTIIVGYLGYLAAVGGRIAGETLIEAAPTLLAKHPVHFLIVGFGPALQAYRRRVEARGLARHFTLTGYVDNVLLPGCLAAMDICVDTLEEGFHSLARSETKLKQYMAMGRACVATAMGENCVDLDDGRCGVLVKPGGPALAQAIDALCADPARRQHLGTAARSRAVAVYDWRQLAQKMVETLRSSYPGFFGTLSSEERP